jgi:hypothetical protein
MLGSSVPHLIYKALAVLIALVQNLEPQIAVGALDDVPGLGSGVCGGGVSDQGDDVHASGVMVHVSDRPPSGTLSPAT